ncbi:hypothetical protein EON80_29210, partial [bacterium]
SGLEAERILREGYIGPYTPLALGQPTGPLYLTALSLRYFGSTIWAVRAVSALLGTITVGVLYLMLRRHSSGNSGQRRVVALLGAALLATSHWHLHFSRIGFPLITWPLCTLLAVWAMLEAARREQARWWCLAGFVLGSGIYSYNAHVVSILALGLWLLLYLARLRHVSVARRLAWLLLFSSMILLAATPMIRYALAPEHTYFEHTRVVSIFTAPASKWLELEGIGPKLIFLTERYIQFWDQLSLHSQVDAGDATGIVPIVPVSMLLVALIGLVWAWKGKRGPLVEITLLLALLLPLGPMLTLDGLNRRAFALSPFLALLAALGIVALSQWNAVAALKRGTKPFHALGFAVVLFGAISFQNLNDYFRRAMPSEPMRWTFGQEMTETCRYLNTLPPRSRVYFYSDRWSAKYET